MMKLSLLRHTEQQIQKDDRVKKAARVEVNISLAFLYWVGIALHP